METDETIIHGQPLPSGKCLEGVYADDHIIIQKIETKLPRSSVTLRDDAIIERSVNSYNLHGALRSEKKRVRKRETILAWGSLVSGRRGRIETSPERHAHICTLGIWVCRLGTVTLPALDALLGNLVHPFQHRKLLSSMLQHVYAWKHQLDPSRVHSIPPRICSELVLACLSLPFAYTDLRAQIPTDNDDIGRLYATDATPSAYGATLAPCPGSVLRALYRVSLHKGEVGRLEWRGEEANWVETDMPRPRRDVDEIFTGLKWKVSRCG